MQGFACTLVQVTHITPLTTIVTTTDIIGIGGTIGASGIIGGTTIRINDYSAAVGSDILIPWNKHEPENSAA